MSKMQEAFDSWMAHEEWQFADREAAWKWMYEAGYQAAIAAVRENYADSIMGRSVYYIQDDLT